MAKPKDDEGASALLAEVRKLLKVARGAAARQVNALLVVTNFEIGRRIVHHEQQGEDRAKYGKRVLKVVAEGLTSEFGRGFSFRNLALMRKFYLAYRERDPIVQTVSALSEESTDEPITPIPSASAINAATTKFTLSWSHYVFLTGIGDESKRSFYEVEATNQQWSLAELRRQFDSSLYERLALSRDKEGVRALAENGQVVNGPEDLLKDPYVLEFLGLDERPRYSESDLETTIISKMEHFLLELGKGFLFEGRQR
ncbi:MAG: PDDEXK nuclease domain-containing protein, partial [Myxococcota bacterium]